MRFSALFKPEIFANLKAQYDEQVSAGPSHPLTRTSAFEASLALGDVCNEDVSVFLNDLPDHSVDLLIVDEDYAADKSFWNPAFAKPDFTNFDWEVRDVPTCGWNPWLYQAARVLKKDKGMLVMFGFPQWATLVKAIAEEAGLTSRAHAVWIKTNGPPRRRPNVPNLASHFECIWIFSNGHSWFNRQEPRVMTNWAAETVCPHCLAIYPFYMSAEWDAPAWIKEIKAWEWAPIFPEFDSPPFSSSVCPACGRQHEVYLSNQIVWDRFSHVFMSTISNEADRSHPTRKPLWLLQHYITILSEEGDLIVDPMCGQGTAGLAAKSLNRKFILNDLDPHWVEVSRRSLALS